MADGFIPVCPVPLNVQEAPPRLIKSAAVTVPVLHSNPTATAKLCLALNGYFIANWGSRTNVTTPPFDLVDNPAVIQEIWARIAEDYSPFNIDVTTEVYAEVNGKAAIIAIGGSYSDWYGSAAGGVAYIGGFYNLSPNVGFVFARNLGNNAKYIAEAASHEAGHLFGLQHQALWNGTTLVASYNQGDSNWAPIMGVGYYSARTTWHNGPTAAGPTSIQDDMNTLAGPYNGFGYKTDESGSNADTANPLPHTAGAVNQSGIITQHTDQDMWRFDTQGGTFSMKVVGAAVGPNLNATIELRSAQNSLITNAAQDISTLLTPGRYYLIVKTAGNYGNVGQYTLTGTLFPPSNTVMVTMSDTQKITLRLAAVDAFGNQALVDGIPVWTSSNSSLVTLIPRPDGRECVVVAKPNTLGSSTISCTADVKMGADTTLLSASVTMQIIHPSQIVAQKALESIAQPQRYGLSICRID